MPDTRRLNVFECHSPSGVFRVNRTAQKAVAVKDPNFSDVTRIIADGHRLAHIGRQDGDCVRLAQSPRELSSPVPRIRCTELAQLWLNPIMSIQDKNDYSLWTDRSVLYIPRK